MLHVGLAEIHFERDELADAHRLVTTGIEQCRRLGYVPALIAGLVVLAFGPRQDPAAGLFEKLFAFDTHSSTSWTFLAE